MSTVGRHMALTLWMLALLVIVVFVVTVRGPIRDSAWRDDCSTLDNGGAIRLSYPTESIPFSSRRQS